MAKERPPPCMHGRGSETRPSAARGAQPVPGPERAEPDKRRNGDGEAHNGTTRKVGSPQRTVGAHDGQAPDEPAVPGATT